MYNVVIIDDEPIIVRGLSQMVPWQEYGCRVAGTASDGQEGLALIRDLKPQIIFSDIYMPKMDGLTMAAGLKSEFEDMELTILTGYRDFDLAQKAIRLGVARFLLKPSNMEEIEEAVREMTNRLKKKGITGESETLESERQKERTLREDLCKTEASGEDGGPERTERMEKPGAAKKRADENSHADGEHDSAAGSFIVKKALDYMKENYCHKVTLGDVADNTYVSQWHLSKLLNRHTGQSFSELLNTIRIEEAKRLLEDPSLRVGDVAEKVGFLDMAHFSRVFKKIVGMSANEYRNQI